MQNTSEHHTKTKRSIIIVTIVLLLLVIGSVYFNMSHKITITINKKGKSTVQGTLSKPVPHQTTPSTTNNSSSQNSTTTNQSNTTTPSQWTTSSSGAITLKQPYSNETIQSGAILSGTVNSNINVVSFILTDNAVGQIAQGNLNVTNGKFSGILNFTNHSTKGTLQIFSPNPTNGAEENIINIDVNYN